MFNIKDEEYKIILPSEIAVLKPEDKQDMVSDREEYNIYFENIIYPYSADLEVDVWCDYGRNLGNCWRIDSFDGVPKEFTLTILLYAPFGRLISKKSTTVKVYDKKNKTPLTLHVIGDSMTRSEYYIEQAVKKNRPITTIGSRSIDLSVRHDGMGGWRCVDYFTRYHDEGAGVSQFLFPKGVYGEMYYGDKLFEERAQGEYIGYYGYRGFEKHELSEGMFFYDDGLKKIENGSEVLVEANPEYEFSYEKYLKRGGFNTPDVVSILFGANELQNSTYDSMYDDISDYIKNLMQLVAEIKKVNADIKIIINLPPCGGDQYCWGLAKGCSATSKRYNFVVKTATEALLESFDNRQNEGIYISPMGMAVDPVYGIERLQFGANLHATDRITQQANWVHPNQSGYRQMGDVLGAVIQRIKNE